VAAGENTSAQQGQEMSVMKKANGKNQREGRGGMAVINLPNGCTVTTLAAKVQQFEHELQELDLRPQSGTQYLYEDVDGTEISVTFEGWDNLNLVLRKSDGEIKQVPVIDMGDGSLVTDWLKRKPMTDAEFCAYQTQRIRQRLLDLGEFSPECCDSVQVVPTGDRRFKIHALNIPATEAEHLVNTLVANGLMTEPVVVAQNEGLTGNYGVN
jgi:hypothetical protein